MATMYQKKVAARRSTSDITRLAQQYQQEIAAVTGEQETAYGQYEKDVVSKMAPYESAVSEYQKKYATYEGEASSYRTQLADYQRRLEDFQRAGPTYTTLPVNRIKIGEQMIDVGTNVPIFRYEIEGQSYTNMSEIKSKYETVMGWIDVPTRRGSTRVPALDAVKKLNPAPTPFTGTAPTAPTAPVKPVVGEFNPEPFKEKQVMAEQTFKREVGERRAARLGAVSRKATRPLLGGTTP
jgi:hypothetical protein